MPIPSTYENQPRIDVPVIVGVVVVTVEVPNTTVLILVPPRNVSF